MIHVKNAVLASLVGLTSIVMVFQACSGLAPGSSHGTGGTNVIGSEQHASIGGGTTTDNPMTARVAMKIYDSNAATHMAKLSVCITGIGISSSTVVNSNSSGGASASSGASISVTSSVTSTSSPGSSSDFVPTDIEVSGALSSFGFSVMTSGANTRLSLYLGNSCGVGYSLKLQSSASSPPVLFTEQTVLKFAGNLSLQDQTGSLLFDSSAYVAALATVSTAAQIPGALAQTVGVLHY